MHRLLVLFAVLALANGNTLEKPEKGNGRIVGGQQTTIQNRPYQVAVLVTAGMDTYICGGSIINPLFILTAAHCFYGLAVTAVNVRVGSTYLNSGGTLIRARYFKMHELYNHMGSDYDIALVNLGKALVFQPSIMPVELIPPNVNMAPGTNTTVSGWGTTSEGGSVSNVLMEVQIPIVTQQYCQQIYNPLVITKRMLCAGHAEGGKDSCQGDSGGPMVVTNGTVIIQNGIVVSGYGCARPGIPGIYTNIASVRPWIKLNAGT